MIRKSIKAIVDLFDNSVIELTKSNQLTILAKAYFSMPAIIQWLIMLTLVLSITYLIEDIIVDDLKKEQHQLRTQFSELSATKIDYEKNIKKITQFRDNYISQTKKLKKLIHSESFLDNSPETYLIEILKSFNVNPNKIHLSSKQTDSFGQYIEVSILIEENQTIMMKLFEDLGNINQLVVIDKFLLSRKVDKSSISSSIHIQPSVELTLRFYINFNELE